MKIPFSEIRSQRAMKLLPVNIYMGDGGYCSSTGWFYDLKSLKPACMVNPPPPLFVARP
jgi:hypothetical protein